MDLDTRARRAAQGIHRAVEVREMSLKLEEPRKVERFDRYQDRKQRNRRIGAIVVAVACVIALAAVAWSGILGGGEAVPANQPPDDVGAVGAATNIGTLTVTDDGCALEVAGRLAAGEATLTVVNETAGLITFDLSKYVPAVVSYDELVASIEEAQRLAAQGEQVTEQPPGVAVGLLSGEVGPERTRTIAGSIVPGTYASVCFAMYPGVGMVPYGIDGPFQVTA